MALLARLKSCPGSPSLLREVVPQPGVHYPLIASHWFIVESELMKQTFTRLALTLPVVWLVVSLVFLLIHMVPGDPIQMMLGEGASPADMDALRHQIGLDQPLWHQYLHYWAGVAHGDLGTSIRLHDSVAHLVGQRYPFTLALTLSSLLLAILLALPAGIVAALKRGKWLDQALSVVSL